MSAATLGPVLHAFFEDHLKVQKGLRPASIRSYRDVLRLFLCFAAKACGRKLSRLAVGDLTTERVLLFLRHLEEHRGNRVATRNHRLAALRGFFEYLASRVPEALVEAQRVAAIPTKLCPPPPTYFLDRDEIQTLFAALAGQGRAALRDRALLLFLYNTGARAQEAAELRVGNLNLGDPPLVHLHGKGDKWRACPLWPQSADLLRELLGQRQGALQPCDPVFVSCRGGPLTRFGIYKVVRRHCGVLTPPNGGPARPVSPHVIRHTTAVHLLEAGVDVNVIRGWLGHVQLDTTNRYAEINIAAKQKALLACQPPMNSSEALPRKPVWRDDKALLKWLENL